MANRNLLIVITVLMVGILGLLALNYTRQADDDSVSGSVNEVVEEIGDEIDDHTTGN